MKVSEIAEVISGFVTVDVRRITGDNAKCLFKGLCLCLKNNTNNWYDKVLEADIIEVFDYDNGEDEDGDLDCGIRIKVA